MNALKLEIRKALKIFIIKHAETSGFANIWDISKKAVGGKIISCNQLHPTCSLSKHYCYTNYGLEKKTVPPPCCFWDTEKRSM